LNLATDVGVNVVVGVNVGIDDAKPGRTYVKFDAKNATLVHLQELNSFSSIDFLYSAAIGADLDGVTNPG
jgi:hypothetical protein